jgi:hypothetical protein
MGPPAMSGGRNNRVEARFPPLLAAHWTPLPDALMQFREELEIGANEILIVVAIERYRRAMGDHVHPSRHRLVRLTGLSVGQVKRATRQLVALGLLHRSQPGARTVTGGRAANDYNLDPLWLRLADLVGTTAPQGGDLRGAGAPQGGGLAVHQRPTCGSPVTHQGDVPEEIASSSTAAAGLSPRRARAREARAGAQQPASQQPEISEQKLPGDDGDGGGGGIENPGTGNVNDDPFPLGQPGGLRRINVGALAPQRNPGSDRR